ncbi:MAG: O-antigen ligase family protein [Mucilaginibacter sp.]|nr:O-antigen ligase family protein [Mucilaginibacter sp.]
MEELFLKDGTTATKISYYHLLAFMASLPFDFFYSHIILASFCLHTIIQLNKKAIKPIFTVNNLLLQSVFFITLLSTIYSINRPEAFNQWGRHITILLFPILFCLSPFDLTKYRRQLLLGFSLVCTLVVLYLYADAFRTIRHYGLPLRSIVSAAFTNQNFADPIEMHATFFSLQLAIALVYLLSELLKKQPEINKAVYGICIIILLAGIIQLSSKSVFVALFLIINLAVPYFLLKDKRRVRFIAVTASLSALIIIGIFTIGSFRVRFINSLKYDLKTTKDNAFDSRLDRWSTATELISKSPIIGHGAGSELGLLHESFFVKKYYNSFLNNLNVHNEYLSMLLKSGIIGLLIYLTTLWFGFKQALQRKDVLLFTFMLLIAVVSLSENILDVDKGIIFYAFFFSFFIFSGDGKTYAITVP